MGRTGWLGSALALTAAQLACQSPSVHPAPPAPVVATTAQSAAPTAQSAAPAAASTVSARKRDEHSLRLATWNMQWLAASDDRGPAPRSSHHYAQLAQIAARLNADIIAVQEVESPRAVERVFDPALYSAFISDSQGAQDVGFVVRRGVQAQPLADLRSLNVGGLRPGADLLVTTPSLQLRLLAVHLKSGCFRGQLQRSKACSKLAAQVPVLEEWIDAREREGVAYAVLGDFNREFYSTQTDEVWGQLNDADPPGLELWSPTSARRSRCWNSRHPNFVDHLVLGRRLRQLASAATFQELLYDAPGLPQHLSDHCPLSIDLELAVGPTRPTNPSAVAAAPPAATTSTAAPHSSQTPGPGRPIKGNISSRGNKLYHLAHCPSYAATKVDPARGERWFHTEPEAQAAGWTKASNCP